MNMDIEIKQENLKEEDEDEYIQSEFVQSNMEIKEEQYDVEDFSDQIDNSDTEKDHYELPWPVYNDHVKVINIKRKENITIYEVKCLHCKKTLSIDHRSTSNFRKHLSALHPSVLLKIDASPKNKKCKKRKQYETNGSSHLKQIAENCTKRNVQDINDYSTSETVDNQSNWDANSTKILIDLHKEFKPVLDTLTIPNENKMWEMISKKLKYDYNLVFSPFECLNRWVFLKDELDTFQSIITVNPTIENESNITSTEISENVMMKSKMIIPENTVPIPSSSDLINENTPQATDKNISNSDVKTITFKEKIRVRNMSKEFLEAKMNLEKEKLELYKKSLLLKERDLVLKERKLVIMEKRNNILRAFLRKRF